MDRLPLSIILRRFESPDETTKFPKGQFDLIRLGGLTIGRASYEPGWRWSEHIGSKTGARYCEVEHIGIVISGQATAAMQDGTIYEMSPGDVFYVPPGHDSWVVGNEAYVSIHLLGAADYVQHGSEAH
jgi:quercetin dioxygenase-like cupin family protein